MRRKDREITDIKIIRDIIDKADVVHIAMYDGKQSYIVTMNFGYEEVGEEMIFYMHCANEGRKLDILKKNPDVCFELDIDRVLKDAPNACGWSMFFKSVVGYGKVTIINENPAKSKGLSILMDHYDRDGKSTPYDFSKFIDMTTILKLTVDSMSCKIKS